MGIKRLFTNNFKGASCWWEDAPSPNPGVSTASYLDCVPDSDRPPEITTMIVV